MKWNTPERLLNRSSTPFRVAGSRFVLTDLSGERPNCYYDAGYAHALNKELILTIRKGEAIHFDLAAHRFIQWETEAELREALNHRLRALRERWSRDTVDTAS